MTGGGNFWCRWWWCPCSAALSVFASGAACTGPPHKVYLFAIVIMVEGYAEGHASDPPVSHRRHHTGWGGNFSASVPSPSGRIPPIFPAGIVKPNINRWVHPIHMCPLVGLINGFVVMDYSWRPPQLLHVELSGDPGNFPGGLFSADSNVGGSLTSTALNISTIFKHAPLFQTSVIVNKRSWGRGGLYMSNIFRQPYWRGS